MVWLRKLNFLHRLLAGIELFRRFPLFGIRTDHGCGTNSWTLIVVDETEHVPDSNTSLQDHADEAESSRQVNFARLQFDEDKKSLLTTTHSIPKQHLQFADVFDVHLECWGEACETSRKGRNRTSTHHEEDFSWSPSVACVYRQSTFLRIAAAFSVSFLFSFSSLRFWYTRSNRLRSRQRIPVNADTVQFVDSGVL